MFIDITDLVRFSRSREFVSLRRRSGFPFPGDLGNFDSVTPGFRRTVTIWEFGI
jgi:hypothetical protein